MRTRLTIMALGLSLVVTPMAASAHHKEEHGKGVEMTRICHFDGERYQTIRVPTKQLVNKRGHAKHSRDIIPMPAEGCPTA